MDKQIDVRLITRNDYDSNWRNSNLVLLPGELAISIPDPESQTGNDEELLPIIKIGNNDTFYSELESGEGLIVNGFHGTLIDLATSGSVSSSEEMSALKIVRGEDGKHIIQLTQAHKKEDDSFIGGILKSDDYQAVDAVVNVFGEDGKVTPATILSKIEAMAGSKFDIDDNDNMIYTETSETVSWSCGGSNNLIN